MTAELIDGKAFAANLRGTVGDHAATFAEKAGRKAGLFGSRLAEAGRGSAVVVLGHATAMPRLREIGAAHAEEYGGGQVLTEASQGGVLDGWWEGVLDAKDKEEDASGEADAKA